MILWRTEAAAQQEAVVAAYERVSFNIRERRRLEAYARASVETVIQMEADARDSDADARDGDAVQAVGVMGLMEAVMAVEAASWVIQMTTAEVEGCLAEMK